MERTSAVECTLCRSPAVLRLRWEHGVSQWRCNCCNLVFTRREPFRSRLTPDSIRLDRPASEQGCADRITAAVRELRTRLPIGSAGVVHATAAASVAAGELRRFGYPVIRMPEDQTETRASKLADQFDFAFSVHTHHSFTRPALEFARLDALLRPHGWLAYLAWNHDLLTEAPVPLAACDCDCALTLSSLRWVADNFGWALETPQPGLALFQKVRRTLGVA